MAFKIALTPTYKTKIVVETPNDQGKFDKSDFLAEFKRLNMDDLDAMRNVPQPEVIEQVLVGWSGLIDDEGNDVPFNSANRNALMRIPQAMHALVEGFWTSIFKAKEKN